MRSCRSAGLKRLLRLHPGTRAARVRPFAPSLVPARRCPSACACRASRRRGQLTAQVDASSSRHMYLSPEEHPHARAYSRLHVASRLPRDDVPAVIHSQLSAAPRTCDPSHAPTCRSAPLFRSPLRRGVLHASTYLAVVTAMLLRAGLRCLVGGWSRGRTGLSRIGKGR